MTDHWVTHPCILMVSAPTMKRYQGRRFEDQSCSFQVLPHCKRNTIATQRIKEGKEGNLSSLSLVPLVLGSKRRHAGSHFDSLEDWLVIQCLLYPHPSINQIISFSFLHFFSHFSTPFSLLIRSVFLWSEECPNRMAVIISVRIGSSKHLQSYHLTKRPIWVVNIFQFET